MELERYIVPFTIYNLAECGYLYPTWFVFVSWMLYDLDNLWSARRRDTLMIGHHVLSLFIAYWLLFFENDNLMVGWCKVAGLLELSGCSTTIYSNLTQRGYWDKLSFLSFYHTIRFWYVPQLLMELDSAGACRVPLVSVWFILTMSAWWVRRTFFSAMLGTVMRIQPTLTYLASF
jgi:hypothetical protein